MALACHPERSAGSGGAQQQRVRLVPGRPGRGMQILRAIMSS